MKEVIVGILALVAAPATFFALSKIDHTCNCQTKTEQWANELCRDGVKKLNFHGSQQITLICNDGTTYFFWG